MAVVENIITPIIQLIFYLIFFGGLIFYVYLLIKKSKIKFILKYKIFRRKYNEEVVEWCVNAINRGMSKIDIKKHLLINGKSLSEVKEILFIYDEVYKKLKGGVENNKNGRQFE